jgi:hypothetical protein
VDVKLIHAMNEHLDIVLCKWAGASLDLHTPINLQRVHLDGAVTCFACMYAKTRFYGHTTNVWRGRGEF